MGHKINPTAYRLAIKLAWLTTYSDDIKLDNWIRKLVNGVFLAFNYFTSQCMLVHSTTSLKIILLVYDNSYKTHTSTPTSSRTRTYNRLFYVIELLKAILEKKLNKKIIFIVRETKIKTFNAKILADWLAYNIEKQPRRLKLLDKLIINK